MVSLHQAILEEIQAASGGMKITDLLIRLGVRGCIFSDCERLEAEIKKIPGLGILEYAYPMGEVVRVKQFVYKTL